MGILSGLNIFGLNKLQDMEVVESETKKAADAEEKAEAKVVREEDFLIKKKFECVCCFESFTNLTVKGGKARLVSQDEDLRPRYEGIDPLKYDVIMCPSCGYATITKCYEPLPSVYRKRIEEQISVNFIPPVYTEETFTYEEAITRHKLALACATVKNGKMSERAYICLKLAWLIRSRMEEMEPNDWKRAKYQNEMEECLQTAYDAFNKAFAKEQFPMCGMNEVTVTYLQAQLARETGHYEDSARLVARLITDKNVSPRIKDMARDLKEKLKKEKADNTEG